MLRYYIERISSSYVLTRNQNLSNTKPLMAADIKIKELERMNLLLIYQKNQIMIDTSNEILNSKLLINELKENCEQQRKEILNLKKISNQSLKPVEHIDLVEDEQEIIELESTEYLELEE
ncbi:hypothetical protein PVAND_005210 [Polypedilum vanderplanki]|uniref:Uncharacterized protein n=1 Tax=Polypedilum vanderplanki TaxID=319348 RepID=A0A9J6BZX0_POLVA|nr:hypothetical protein PVAND_005210 [Polypedilum vanderplanki]